MKLLGYIGTFGALGTFMFPFALEPLHLTRLDTPMNGTIDCILCLVFILMAIIGINNLPSTKGSHIGY